MIEHAVRKIRSAVSPAVGVILVVAITVILSAVIGAFVLNQSGTDESAQAGVTADDSSVDIVSMGNADKIIIKHENGTTLDTITSVGDGFEAPTNGTYTIIGVKDGSETVIREAELTESDDASGGGDQMSYTVSEGDWSSGTFTGDAQEGSFQVKSSKETRIEVIENPPSTPDGTQANVAVSPDLVYEKVDGHLSIETVEGDALFNETLTSVSGIDEGTDLQRGFSGTETEYVMVNDGSERRLLTFNADASTISVAFTDTSEFNPVKTVVAEDDILLFTSNGDEERIKHVSASGLESSEEISRTAKRASTNFSLDRVYYGGAENGAVFFSPKYNDREEYSPSSETYGPVRKFDLNSGTLTDTGVYLRENGPDSSQHSPGSYIETLSDERFVAYVESDGGRVASYDDSGALVAEYATDLGGWFSLHVTTKHQGDEILVAHGVYDQADSDPAKYTLHNETTGAVKWSKMPFSNGYSRPGIGYNPETGSYILSDEESRGGGVMSNDGAQRDSTPETLDADLTNSQPVASWGTVVVDGDTGDVQSVISGKALYGMQYNEDTGNITGLVVTSQFDPREPARLTDSQVASSGTFVSQPITPPELEEGEHVKWTDYSVEGNVDAGDISLQMGRPTEGAMTPAADVNSALEGKFRGGQAISDEVRIVISAADVEGEVHIESITFTGEVVEERDLSECPAAKDPVCYEGEGHIPDNADNFEPVTYSAEALKANHSAPGELLSDEGVLKLENSTQMGIMNINPNYQWATIELKQGDLQNWRHLYTEGGPRGQMETIAPTNGGFELSPTTIQGDTSAGFGFNGNDTAKVESITLYRFPPSDE